jgi:hypothetical protein
MEPRLASSVLAGSLLRLAETQGGFGAVLAKGDAISGALTVILAERGRKVRILERMVQPDGRYLWQDVGIEAAANEENLNRFLEKRRRFDPDIWILELDIASAERFAAEMNASN